MEVVVIGGSVAGLISSLALARDGHRVEILEKDPTPMPASPAEAFKLWKRQGAPQVMHSHAFLGRMHNMIRDREPELLKKLLEHGAEELKWQDAARKNFKDPVFVPSDDDITLLACSRVTFEWVLRLHVLETGLVTYREGVEVLELIAEKGDSVPVVTGVTVRDHGQEREEIRGDLIVDASGRRTKLREWLEGIGCSELEAVKSATGIFYSSRFYKLRKGVKRPNEDGFSGGDLGYIKFGVFPAENDTFSITLSAAPDDDALRAILRTGGFEKCANAIPLVAEWVDPEVSAPISDAHGMANLNNMHRLTVKDGEPLALGLVAIGDARVHANPLTGRGCTLAWICAYALADAVREHPDDLRELALAQNSVVLNDCAPWLQAQMRSDVDAIEVNTMQREGEDPYKVENEDGTTNEKAYMRALIRDGLVPASREDFEISRLLARIGHMLDMPSDVMKRPETMQKAVECYEQRHDRPPRVEGPTREEMVSILAG
jgi:2-polyprenyl-6-methoxyphenol hydroxylase-like FAD-dependent oxidoreductase